MNTTPRQDRMHVLISQWTDEGLGWEDIAVLLDRRGLRAPREYVRNYVLKLNRFNRRAA
jgi:hypothetical protein